MSQAIKVFLRAAGTKGTVVDELNAGSANTPSFAIFTDTEIRLKLYRDASTAYTAAELSGYAWEFWADGDWDAATSPKIGTTTGITVASDGTIVIPIATGNLELVTWLGTADSREMKAELLGYDGVSAQYADFCVQFPLKVTNRVFYTGSYEPSPIEGLYYTKAQSDARFPTKTYVGATFQTKLDISTASTREYYLREDGTFQPVSGGTGGVTKEAVDNAIGATEQVRFSTVKFYNANGYWGSISREYNQTEFFSTYVDLVRVTFNENNNFAMQPLFLDPNGYGIYAGALDVGGTTYGASIEHITDASVPSDGNDGTLSVSRTPQSTVTFTILNASTVNSRLDTLEEVDSTLDSILS